MFFSFRYIFIFVLLISSSHLAYSQNTQSPSADLFKQAERLMNQRDFEKAKLTLKLYQKYEEKNAQNWLKAQSLIIQSEIELNNFVVAETLINKTKEKIKNLPQANQNYEKSINLLEAEILEIQNKFEQAEKIYRALLKKNKAADIEIKLANNLIDRVLSGYSKQAQKDYEELRSLVSAYEKNNKRNPLELIRIKQKVSSYQMVNKETLSNLKKLETYWLKKDEYTIFRIYINNVLRNYDQAYNVWFENKDIITLKSHPLSVPVLVTLSRHFLDKAPKKTSEILKALPLLVRDKYEKNLVELLSIEQLLKNKKIAEAYAVYENSIKINPQGHNRSEMEINLAEAYLEVKEYKTCRKLISKIQAKAITNAELKSRKLFIDASLLQSEGKDKEAAVLFLRVGQTATNAQTALKSLFMAGKAFYNAKQCNRAVIAFKILLEKKRNKFTDDGLYYLSLSHAQCKDFPKALATIDRLILSGKNPELKKKALFEKGDYWVMAGNNSKAIEAYNDFTVVYSNDSRNAAIWYKIYNIHLKQKQIPQCETILDKIIKKSSSNSPEVYSSALHQKALLHQLKGENRQSISLWQKYLEFNQKVSTKHKDEVKLMLAAAFQNSESLNLSASATIYEEVLEKSKDVNIRNIALKNLLEITASDPKVHTETLKKLLNTKISYNTEAVDLICAQALALKDLQKDSAAFINKLADSEHKRYWQAKALYVQNNKDSAKKGLKLLKTVKQPKLHIQKLALQRDFHQVLKDPEATLNSCLEIIYLMTAKENWSHSSNWTEIIPSSSIAISLLIEQGRVKQAAKIYQRLVSGGFPIPKNELSKIEKLLKVKK